MLNPKHIMIFDSGSDVFVWVGSHSDASEKSQRLVMHRLILRSLNAQLTFRFTKFTKAEKTTLSTLRLKLIE